MFRKILLYGLPIYLYGLEILLKTVANLKADSVAGPTLAGAGIGFLLPLTQLKAIPIDDQTLAEALNKIKASVHSKKDKDFTDLVWLAFFMFLLAWMFSIFLTIKRSGSGPPGAAVASTDWPLVIGCTVFAFSIVLAELKERL